MYSRARVYSHKDCIKTSHIKSSVLVSYICNSPLLIFSCQNLFWNILNISRFVEKERERRLYIQKFGKWCVRFSMKSRAFKTFFSLSFQFFFHYPQSISFTACFSSKAFRNLYYVYLNLSDETLLLSALHLLLSLN